MKLEAGNGCYEEHHAPTAVIVPKIISIVKIASNVNLCRYICTDCGNSGGCIGDETYESCGRCLLHGCLLLF